MDKRAKEQVEQEAIKPLCADCDNQAENRHKTYCKWAHEYLDAEEDKPVVYCAGYEKKPH